MLGKLSSALLGFMLAKNKKMVGIDTNGQFSRIIEIPCMKGELTGSKGHCKQLEEFIDNYAGVGGEAFIEFLFKEGLLMPEAILKEKYNSWVRKLNGGVLGSTPIGSRMADKVALIMLSAELLEQCFGLGMDLNSVQDVLESSIHSW